MTIPRTTYLQWRRACGGIQYKFPGPGGPEGGPGPYYVAYVCISRQQHYLSVVQIKPFRPSPSLSATESFFRFYVNILAGPSLLGSPKELFHRDPAY